MTGVIARQSDGLLDPEGSAGSDGVGSGPIVRAVNEQGNTAVPIGVSGIIQSKEQINKVGGRQTTGLTNIRLLKSDVRRCGHQCSQLTHADNPPEGKENDQGGNRRVPEARSRRSSGTRIELTRSSHNTANWISRIRTFEIFSEASIAMQPRGTHDDAWGKTTPK